MSNAKSFLEHVNDNKVESFKEEEFIHQKKDKKRWIIPFMIIIILSVACYLYINQKVTMIDLSNLTYQEAENWCLEKQLVLSNTEVYHEEVESGRIITQKTPIGEDIEKDSVIQVSVSKGKDPYKAIGVPEFDSTWSRSSIMRWLEQNDIQNYNFVTINVDDISEDYLISYRLIGSNKETFNRSSEIEFALNEVTRTQQIEVPSFVNETLTEVDIWAQNNGANYTHSEEYSSIYEEGRISYQSIRPNQEISLEDTIHFVVSKGNDRENVIMPNLLGSSLEAVDVWAKDNDINYTYSEEYSSIYEENKISDQSIKPNEEISTKDTIHFVVSKGNDGENVIISNLLGGNLAEADVWLKAHEVNYTYSYQFSSLYNYNIIIDQSFNPGHEIDNDDTVHLTVSRGEELVIPDFSTMAVEEARDYATQYPDVIEVIEKYDGQIARGECINQTGEAGKSVDHNDEITVTYSLGNSVAVSDFRNTSILELEAWVREQNDLGANITLNTIEQQHANIPSGYVINQNAYNDFIGLESSLEVIISSGMTIPDFTQMSKEEAIRYGENSLLTVYVEEKYQTDTNYGDFISQSIEAGMLGDEMTSVVVSYSLGKDVAVPNYMNQPIIELETWVREQNRLGANLRLNIEQSYVDSTEYGDIISQNVYNEYIDITSDINVMVSLGESYRLINFTSYSRDTVEAHASYHDLTIIFEEVQSDTHRSGRVVSQYPEPGTVISKEKDFITIQVAE